MTGAVVLVSLLLTVAPWLARRSVRVVAGRGLGSGAGAGGGVVGSVAWGYGADASGPGGRTFGAVGRRPGRGRPTLVRAARPMRATRGWLGVRHEHAEDADPALLLDLVAVALAAGAPVPQALVAVGSAWPGGAGEAVARAARALALGAPWDVAWSGVVGGARTLADSLEPAWLAGASPVPLLRAAADRARARRRAAARTAAGRLGVQLVVPLGVCFLPAFVLVGLVPVVVSLAAGLFG